ncbi:Phospholipid/glycerol acyltransferase [Desulfonema limicola]|uniref:Phospholipid/glycerol acyltransferase n=1 Tax=Desulfonema limicola TaxID=45656 RepID=A0A975GFE1_9BACT|nr:Phospholipid/glycerol acyltransferase [Desulfonema limicola]
MKTKPCYIEKIPGAPTFFYYSQVMNVVFNHGIIASRNNYNRNIWTDGAWAMINIAESVGAEVCVSGLENVAEYIGPLVYISNHMSMVDAFFLPGFLLEFNDITFVIKEDLLYYPFFGKVMQAVNPIAVTRKNPREDLKTVLNQGMKKLTEGRSVIVFPQSTRSHIFDASKFNSLGVKLARKAGVPIIPVALKTDFQGYGKYIKDLGKIDPSKTIYIKFGRPLTVTGKGQTAHEHIIKFIAENVRQWGGRVRNVL